MTPFEFGQKLAADTGIPQPPAPPTPPTTQPMQQALASQSKVIPHMLNMTRAAGRNPIDIVPRIEHGVKTRTGQFPNNWETTQALMDGLSFPYPAK